MSPSVCPRPVVCLVFALGGLADPSARAQGFGSALQFNGAAEVATRDYVLSADDPAFDFSTGDFTLAFWILKPNVRREAAMSKRVSRLQQKFWSFRADDRIALEMWNGPNVRHNVVIPAPFAAARARRLTVVR